MYIEHWKTKVSSLLGSEPSKVSGVRGLTEVDVLPEAGMLPMRLASSVNAWARLGSSVSGSEPSEASEGLSRGPDGSGSGE